MLSFVHRFLARSIGGSMGWSSWVEEYKVVPLISLIWKFITVKYSSCVSKCG